MGGKGARLRSHFETDPQSPIGRNFNTFKTHIIIPLPKALRSTQREESHHNLIIPVVMRLLRGLLGGGRNIQVVFSPLLRKERNYSLPLPRGGEGWG